MIWLRRLKNVASNGTGRRDSCLRLAVSWTVAKPENRRKQSLNFNNTFKYCYLTVATLDIDISCYTRLLHWTSADTLDINHLLSKCSMGRKSTIFTFVGINATDGI